MTGILREPLVHFLALGLLVFLTDQIWGGGESGDERTIIVSKSVQARLDETWLRTTGRSPSEEDRKGLINQYVQDEALSREARLLGLAENDQIIRNRLAQKMRFFAGSGEADDNPSDSELEAWFERNRDKFDVAERRRFNHIYFSPERHGSFVENAAAAGLDELEKGADWKTIGDPFMQERGNVTLTHAETVRNFGPDFAKSLFDLPEGEWSRPLGSAFGLHLVRVGEVVPARQMDFQTNIDKIRSGFREERSETARQREIDRIVERYDVVLAN